MSERDGKHAKAFLAERRFQIGGKSKLAERNLDGQLPQRGDAENDVVLGICDGRACRRPERWGTIHPPKKSMSVEKEPHSVAFPILELLFAHGIEIRCDPDFAFHAP